MFKRPANALEESAATLVHLLAFGNFSAGSAPGAIRQTFGGVDWPVKRVEGSARDGSPLAGRRAFAFAGGEGPRIWGPGPCNR